MPKKEKKFFSEFGFTLIELLAVIIILGVLLLIAVPAVSRYIDSSRKNSYISSVKALVDSVSVSINSLELPFTPTAKQAVIVPFSAIHVERGKANVKSPYANYDPDRSYIIVTYENGGYNYYVSAVDESGHGIPFVKDSNITTNAITIDKKELDNNVIPLSTIKSGKVIDTDFLTMKYVESKGEYLKISLCYVPYTRGSVIKLKDESLWYATLDSNEDEEMINLVSYYHMETDSSLYGLQSSSKTSPVISFHGNQSVNSYDESSIKLVADAIVSAAKIKLAANGLNMANSTVRMPLVEDFGCSLTAWTCIGNVQELRYFKTGGDGYFWTTQKDPERENWFIAIGPDGKQLATAENKRGIRIILNTLKSNIDKQGTKQLN